MPSKLDLKIYQGDDFPGLVTLYNQDGTASDITGHTASAQIRRAVADEEPEVTVEIETTVIPPNQIVLAIPHAQTEALSGEYVWDLQLTSPGGMITTVVAGKVKLTQEVTRVA